MKENENEKNARIYTDHGNHLFQGIKKAPNQSADAQKILEFDIPSYLYPVFI